MAVPLVVLVDQLVELLKVQALVAVCFMIYMNYTNIMKSEGTLIM